MHDGCRRILCQATIDRPKSPTPPLCPDESRSELAPEQSVGQIDIDMAIYTVSRYARGWSLPPQSQVKHFPSEMILT
jgi:hypothetical protein